jgi:3-oxoacid CoA-transferase subunit A
VISALANLIIAAPNCRPVDHQPAQTARLQRPHPRATEPNGPAAGTAPFHLYEPNGRRTLAKKVYPDAKSALAGQLKDGMTIMAGGFGLCGIPETLILAIRDSGVKNLTFVSNNAGIDGAGLGLLLETRQVKKMISSYVGENKLFAEQYLAGVLEIEFNPQGTLAERIRAGGAGIPAFFTKTGYGTMIGEGKDVREFDGEKYIMERGIVADLSIVHAWKGDTEGNLVYRKTARNFNPMMATAGRITIAEVEHLVEPGQIDPDHIITPGVYVQRIVHVPDAQKKIEQRTVRKRS